MYGKLSRLNDPWGSCCSSKYSGGYSAIKNIKGMCRCDDAVSISCPTKGKRDAISYI